jgi:hypothetical protein
VALEGPAITHVDAPIVADRLVSTAEGVTITAKDGGPATVRYDRLAGALTWNDGSVVLVAREGGDVSIEPALWRDGAHVCREIRQRVPAELLIQMGSRAPETVPKPATTPRQRAFARLRRLAFDQARPLLGGFGIAVALYLLVNVSGLGWYAAWALFLVATAVWRWTK